MELLTLQPWPCSPCCIWLFALASHYTPPASASTVASAVDHPETQREGVAVLGTEEDRDGGGKKTGMKNRESFWAEKKLSQYKERGKR